MGDLAIDTTLSGDSGIYQCELSTDWRIWGPNGGYIAAILLRAAAAVSQFDRPATLSVHFLAPADFSTVEIRAEVLRGGKRSESVRASMTQHGRPIAEAMVWLVGDDTAGVDLDWTTMPSVPGPADLKPIEDLVDEEEEGPPFPFWDNIECRPIEWIPRDEWDTKRPMYPAYRNWFRLRPAATFDDPVLEAARVVVFADLVGWPALVRAFTPGEIGWMAPNLDLNMTFHQSPTAEPYLFLDGEAPLSTNGLAGGTGRVWTPDGRLVATTTQQMLFRRLPPPPPTG